MAAFYIGIGLYFVINPSSFQSVMAVEYVKILGIVLIAYGLFRGYRTYISDLAKNR